MTCDVCGCAVRVAVPFQRPRGVGWRARRWGTACSMACVRRSRAVMEPYSDYALGYGGRSSFVGDDWLAEPPPPEPTPAEQRAWLCEHFGQPAQVTPYPIERALMARLSGIVLP